MKDYKIERYILCKEVNGEEIELINEYGYFRWDHEAKRKAELVGDDIYIKLVIL